MAPKRGSKRAASGGTGKKRGRPSKKQKEEEKKQEDDKDTETTDEQQQQAGTTNDTSDNKQQDDSTKQPTDEAKTDVEKTDGAADTEKEESGTGDDAAAEKKGGDDEYKAEELEKGHLYFFYRPKVDASEVKGTGDVQKFYILISPEGAEGRPAKEEDAEKNRKEEREAKETAEGGKKHRLLVVSSKMLPQVGQGGRRNPWSFVDAVGSLEEVEGKLERYSYDTKTRGHREIQPARLCGEARYELIKTSHRNSSQSHLVYELEVPEQPCDVQQAFNIAKEGQFLINVKNPDFESAAWSERPYAGFKPEAKAKIPAHLMEHFQGKRQAEVRYCPVTTTEFLDLPHAELVMIAVKKGVHEEGGEQFQRLVKDMEEQVDEDEPQEDAKKVLEELKMDESEHPDATEEFK